jgi:hypothetical protein
MSNLKSECNGHTLTRWADILLDFAKQASNPDLSMAANIGYDAILGRGPFGLEADLLKEREETIAKLECTIANCMTEITRLNTVISRHNEASVKQLTDCLTIIKMIANNCGQ